MVPVALLPLALSLWLTAPMLAQAADPAAPSAAERRPFTRVVEREDGGQLDVLVATYAKGEATLTLFAALHVADAGHYADLQRRFASFDVLLYELIADPDDRPHPGMQAEDDWFNLLQGGLGRGLGLVHQGDHVDYRQPNFVHADMTHEEWEEALERAGSSLPGELMNVGVLPEPDREAEAKQKKIDLVAAFRSGRGVHELRIAGARLLAEAEGQRREPTVIIEGRNEKCLRVLAEQLAAGRKKLAIYYGAAHMEHLERRLLTDLGWTRTGEEWLMAWDNRQSLFPMVEKGLQQKRYRARQDVELLTEALRAWQQANPGGEPTWPRLREVAPGGKLPGRADGKDPWGRDYVLRKNPRSHEVRCLGSDGLLDTDDDLAGAPSAFVPASDPARAADALLLPMVEQKLASDAAADVAWGGQLAWQHRLRPAQRSLREALARWRDREGLEARFVRLHLLDGMLGAGAKLPAEQVEFLLDDALTRPGTVALIADGWRSNVEALHKLAMAPAPSGDMARTAAARLVVAHELKSGAFTRHLVDDLSATFSVRVRDAATRSDGWNSAVGLGGPAQKVVRVPAGFPPPVRHWITERAQGDSESVERVLLPASGSRPTLLLLRTADTRYHRHDLMLGDRVERLDGRERLDLLRAMAATEIETWTWVEHEFRDAAKYLAEVAAARDAQRRQLDEALAALRRRGWLGGQDLVGHRFPLEVKIHDERGDKSLPLPPLPPQ